MDQQLEARPAEAGVVEMGGTAYMRDGKGHLVPLDLVRPEDVLEDQTVRKIVQYAEDLSAQISRFRGHTFDDVTACVELIAEKYGAKRGGVKGNVTLSSYDGCFKVVIQVQDQLTFGPQLRAAKELVDQCISDWSGGAAAELLELVQHAFQVDKEGKINTAALFALRRLKIEREPWPAAMEALGDAIRVIGSKEYCRFYRRADPRGRWEPITIDLASA
ncbi:DUF3164 family protein [Azorhizobium doebereinerae]|uniref:DUF3164 family protein n=1 Tax=Azorhizobium doebereinerae TaxID=281091 RepID=UPI000406F953|nr:DUF3164 family protein [Azorhizobium doebereinerae]